MSNIIKSLIMNSKNVKNAVVPKTAVVYSTEGIGSPWRD